MTREVKQAMAELQPSLPADVRLRPVLLDTGLGACVASRAVIQVKHENALAFIQTLLDILVEDSVTHS